MHCKRKGRGGRQVLPLYRSLVGLGGLREVAKSEVLSGPGGLLGRLLGRAIRQGSYLAWQMSHKLGPFPQTTWQLFHANNPLGKGSWDPRTNRGSNESHTVDLSFHGYGSELHMSWKRLVNVSKQPNV